jgi:hypothetical protein
MLASSIGEAEKNCRKPGQVSRVDGGNSHVVYGQKFPGEEGFVRWCIVMLQQPVVLPKFRIKSSHIFT